MIPVVGTFDLAFREDSIRDKDVSDARTVLKTRTEAKIGQRFSFFFSQQTVNSNNNKNAKILRF